MKQGVHHKDFKYSAMANHTHFQYNENTQRVNIPQYQEFPAYTQHGDINVDEPTTRYQVIPCSQVHPRQEPNSNISPPALASTDHRHPPNQVTTYDRSLTNVPVVRRDVSSTRHDFVDGDEPGIDPELERLTQPHTVLTQARYQRFADEEVRKRTFATWTNRFPSVMLLVMSGFFFLGGRDSVQCFHCGIILHSWEESDLPDEEHKKHSPNCVFLRLKNGLGQSRDNQQRTQPEQPTRRPEQHQEMRIMQAVAGLGHSMDIISEAMDSLKLSGQQNIDTSMLVDAVFEIENNEDFPETHPSVVADNSSEDVIHGASREPSCPNVPEVHDRRLHAEFDSKTKDIIEKAKQLEKENEDLRKQTTCRVCFENPATEVFLPCGHLACCESCSGRLTECPYCRKKILRTVHVFLP